MIENIIVGIIILAAAAFTVYRLFFRPSCGCDPSSGCGSGCGCGQGSCDCGKPATNGAPVVNGKPDDGAKGGGCCCGK